MRAIERYVMRRVGRGWISLGDRRVCLRRKSKSYFARVPSRACGDA